MTDVAMDPGRSRLAALDLARGAAIVAMVVYHAAFNLSIKQLIPVLVPNSLGWTILARLTAGTFLAVVGVSLVLASRKAIHWPAFLRRLAWIVAGAALVSLATWWMDPRTWVFFGILHLIALSSVMALPFLRLPTSVVAVVAAAFIALPFVYRSATFDAWWLIWIGLYVEPPTSIDFTPVFPWFGVVLGGVVVGRLLLSHGQALWRWRPDNAGARWLMMAGRWSLVIYLVHQPILYGLASLVAAAMPANSGYIKGNVISQCVATCDLSVDPACPAKCDCMISGMWGTDLISIESMDSMTPDQQARLEALLQQCDPAPPQLFTPVPDGPPR